MHDSTFLTLLPIVLLVVLSFTVAVYHYSGPEMTGEGFLTESKQPSEDICTCNRDGKDVDFCYKNNSPVLGGVDMVQFFTVFKLPDGSYNESKVGQQGSNLYSSVYNNYTYNFVSKANKRIFEKDPSSYAPQWGGFCAWGIATEGCPRYGWSPDCMGPHGSWYHWTVQKEKIYFFWFNSAKENFLNGTDANILAGDIRWGGWYPDLNDAPVSTKCVETEPVGLVSLKS